MKKSRTLVGPYKGIKHGNPRKAFSLTKCNLDITASILSLLLPSQSAGQTALYQDNGVYAVKRQKRALK
jgi:hypothetical protein